MTASRQASYSVKPATLAFYIAAIMSLTCALQATGIDFDESLELRISALTPLR